MRNRPRSSPSPAPAIGHGGLMVARADPICLPPALINAVPNCAVSCLQVFTSTKYPGSNCQTTTDLNFLCTQSNTSGLTIGEAAVQCVVSFCRGQDQLNLGGYNVCIGVQGARPNTAQTITATLLAATTSATMDNLPQTISNPTSTMSVSMVVMDTGAPAVPTTMLTTTSSVPSAPENTSTYTTAGAVAMPGQGGNQGGLGTAQVVGIAIGGAVMAIGVLAFLTFIFCIRKRRQERRKSQRKSRIFETTPPTNFESPPEDGSAVLAATTKPAPAQISNGRFYASQPPMEDKRRSFWRKSIKPEEIGVAVSPKMPGDISPISASSQHSISRLLPALPNRTLVPAPLDIEASRERRRRPSSDGTMSDIESTLTSANQQAIYIDNQTFVLEKAPPAKKLRSAAAPITLPSVPEYPVQKSKTQPASAARIPLTPTYDNGNIDLISPPFSASTVAESVVTVSQFPLPSNSTEQKPTPSSSYGVRSVLKKPPPSTLPLRSLISPPMEPLEQPRNPPPPPIPRPASNQPFRPVSLSSEYTEIEEDSTPEELNKQLGLSSNPSAPRNSRVEIRADDAGQSSPIKDLRYPQIPRSAAVSRQAERPAQLRGSLPQDPFAPLPSTTFTPRDPVARTRVSFLQGETSSSDGYMSDETIEWPVPPMSENSTQRAPPIAQSSLKQKMARLRNSNGAGNRGSPLAPIYSPSLNEMMTVDSRMKTTQTTANLIPERSPSTRAKLTPNKAENGDLYLTVQDI
ncbi:hypothetical protein LTR84_008972 [Exophiala bonariae]|uniref:Extracellular membrane protein CFEM domain-containing protein n=1 Tax=Exophiala bonariae TaxID=1690606 RepID=A0AAV9MXZ4_9EURO|nr:hypothetical protein LTR84_008972 [Exophiala bonariae]